MGRELQMCREERANKVARRSTSQSATPGIADAARATDIYTAERFSDHAPLIIDYALPRR